MTLLQLAERIDTGVRRTAQRELIAEQVTQLKRLHTGLEQLEPILTEGISLVDASMSSGIDISIEGLVSLRGRLEDGAARAAAGDGGLSDLQELATEARTEVASIKNTVTLSWHEVVDAKVPQRDGLTGLAQTFQELDPDNEMAREFERAVNDAQRLTRTPPSAEAVSRLNEAAARIPELLTELVGDEPSVRSFFELVARGGAPLDSLTEEVRAWLKAKGFEESLRIVPGGPAA